MNEVFYENKVITGENFVVDVCFDYFNERIRVDDYRGNVRAMLNYIDEVSPADRFKKIIIKTRVEDYFILQQNGYVKEAGVTNYFHGNHMCFYTKYKENKRRNSNFWIEEDQLIVDVTTSLKRWQTPKLDDGFTMRIATEQDSAQLAALYKQVFQVYPTPLDQPKYVAKAIKEDTIFCVIVHEGRIISAAGAELNERYFNAELTNCATLPSYRKHGLMKHLLLELEKELKKKSIYCSYTIARSRSYGMNAAFHQLGYKYTGRLTNNCYIFDKIEDMNVWVKDLADN